MYAALVVVILAVAGVIAAYFMMQSQPTSTNDMAGMDHGTMSMSDNGKSETYKKYAALKGEAYDKAFLADMVVHHDSALNMAEMANGAAVRQEIRDLAANINATQGQEIGAMNALQEQWGYPKTSGHMMTGGNMDEMEGMAMDSDALKGLSGEAFDKKFIELMIKHHQDAVDMSEPAATNSNRQEIKDLAKTIITAQTKEIVQMQMWQKQWGYIAN
jgi:uncharacterized protein (DUF305 family)